MEKNTDSDFVIIGVRISRSLCSSIDYFCKLYNVNRSCFLRLLLSWFSLSASKPSRFKFTDYIRQFKKFRPF